MMNLYRYPEIPEWPVLCRRTAIRYEELDPVVRDILSRVRRGGDIAISELSGEFDGFVTTGLEVTPSEIADAIGLTSKRLRDAIEVARKNIEKFHSSQTDTDTIINIAPGVKCWRSTRAIEKIGLYIPGGSAPLFSTVLMLGVPAILAGCSEIIICTPPGNDGKINPAILYTAQLLGISKIYKAGGAQAIAAMAYGTETIPKVFKIFGPGNQYVTRAKELVQLDGVAIDMPAGPSELLVIADETGDPVFIAADLLSQAEHGPDSQVILVSTSESILVRSMAEIKIALRQLPREKIAVEALKNSKAVLLKNIDECLKFSNLYSPEHLVIASDKPGSYVDGITSAGSVFLGNYSCESAGDYASGTNHTLPTNGYARSYSGVSLDSFIKKITFQEITREGLQNIGEAIEIMAETEKLLAHKNAVSVRLNKRNYV